MRRKRHSQSRGREAVALLLAACLPCVQNAAGAAANAEVTAGERSAAEGEGRRAAAARELFSVNFFGYGRDSRDGDVWQQEAVRRTVQLDPGDLAGAEGFATAGWHNVFVRAGTTEITSTRGSSATVHLISHRNGGPYHWVKTRNPATFDIPNAKMIEAKINGTFDPGDGSKLAIFEVADIPFAAYDFVIYLATSAAWRGNGRGTVRINGGPEQRFTLPDTEPDGTLVEITDETTPGNYIVFRGYSGSTLRVDIRGDGFNHLGPSGIQIVQADRARPPLDITDFVFDPATRQVTLAWRSFPGDRYGICWMDEREGLPVFVNPMVSAHPSDDVTTYGPFESPVPNPTRDTFRIGPPDPKRPLLERVWGNNRTVSLTFSKPLAGRVALEPSHYAVVTQDGGRVAVESARFHPRRETVALTTAAPLALDTVYRVTFSNLADLAGYPVDGDNVAQFRTWDDNPDGVKVFILSGQSNMVGRGSRENGQDGVSGGIGSLRHMAVGDPANYARLLVNPDDPAGSPWRDRDDVRLWWNRADIGGNPNITKGYVGPDTTPTGFGPEYGFGWAVGELFEEPVLLIKSCWGGKSLFGDFRPPRAVAARGGEVGPYYLELIAQVRQVLDNLGTEFPEFAGMGYQIAGFGWHQGWNDCMNDFPASEYEANLTDFIKDLRDEFGRPDLPVSIGATGHGGFDQRPRFATVVAAQLAVADPGRHPEFAGTVFTADTRPFWRDVSVSPRDDGSHWNQNGESFFLIGYSMGKGMVEMLSR